MLCRHRAGLQAADGSRYGAALPKEVSHKDAVYNLSRAALVPAAFCEGRHDLLAIATEDKLHQPTVCR